MPGNGRAKLPPGELQALIKRKEDKQQAKLEVLLQLYGIAIDDENVCLVKGLPAESINRIAKRNKNDIIVMGTLCRAGIPGFYWTYSRGDIPDHRMFNACSQT